MQVKLQRHLSPGNDHIRIFGDQEALSQIHEKSPKSIHFDGKENNFLWFKTLNIYDILVYLRDHGFQIGMTVALANYVRRVYTEPPVDFIRESPIEHKKEGFKLREYQLEGVKKIVWKGNLLLADEQGTGKTIQTIGAMVYKKEHGTLEKALVLCPSGVIEQWQSEVQEWSNLGTMIITDEAPPIRKLKYKSFKENPYLDVLITNYEKLRGDLSLISEINWDLVVLDEASYKIKNPESDLFNLTRKIPRKNTLALTGTPMENSVRDIHTIITLLEPSILPNWREFQFEYCIWNPGANKYTLSDAKKVGLSEQLQRTILLRRTKEDVAPELPPKTYVERPIEFSTEERTIYDKMKKDLLLEIGDEVFDLFNPLAFFTRSRQFCESWALLDETKGISSKIKSILEIIENTPNNEQVIVFSCFAQQVKELHKYVKDSIMTAGGSVMNKKTRFDAVESFRRGDCRVLISSDVLAYGVNLQQCHNVIHSSPWWNYAKLAQREDRTHRIKQKEFVIVYRMCINKSIEQFVWKVAKAKQENANTILKKRLFTRVDVAKMLDGEVPDDFIITKK